MIVHSYRAAQDRVNLTIVSDSDDCVRTVARRPCAFQSVDESAGIVWSRAAA